MTNRFPRIFIVLMIAALTGGSLAFAIAQAPEAEAVSAEEAVAPAPAPTGGGCCCCGGQGAGMRGSGSCQGRGGGAGMGPRHGQGRGQGVGQGGGRGMGPRHGQTAGPGGGQGGGREWMAATHNLVHSYRQEIVREVEKIDNGVVTVTRAPGHPEAIATLQQHVNQMKAQLEGGGRVRGWDPLFRELFDHYQEIDLQVELLDDGVKVTETSSDPEVVKLIQAHADKVNEFVARGPAAVHEPTDLPPDYESGQ